VELAEAAGVVAALWGSATELAEAAGAVAARRGGAMEADVAGAWRVAVRRLRARGLGSTAESESLELNGMRSEEGYGVDR
jgi:hypothetical protein